MEFVAPGSVSVHRIFHRVFVTLCVCSLDAQVQCFRQNGFVCLPNVFSGDQLRRMQAAWCRALARADTFTNRTDEGHKLTLEELFAEAVLPQSPVASKPQAGCIHGAEKDPVLLDTLDAPPVIRLLEAIIGPGRFTSDDVALAGVQACAAVNEQSLQDSQRVWGRFGAAGPADGWPHPSHRVIQVVISLSDDEGLSDPSSSLRLPFPRPFPMRTLLSACICGSDIASCTCAGVITEHQLVRLLFRDHTVWLWTRGTFTIILPQCQTRLKW